MHEEYKFVFDAWLVVVIVPLEPGIQWAVLVRTSTSYHIAIIHDEDSLCSALGRLFEAANSLSVDDNPDVSIIEALRRVEAG